MFKHKKLITFIFTLFIISSLSQSKAFEVDLGNLPTTTGIDMTDIKSDLDMDMDLDSNYSLGDTFEGELTGDIVIDMFSEVKGDITINEGSLTLETNADLSGVKVTLNDVEFVKLGTNVSVETLEGSVGDLTLETNSTVNNMNLSVAGTASFGVNSTVKKINLKANKLDVSVNSEISEGIIYVYENFEGGVNSGFKGKLTVYGDSSMSVNSDVTGRFCSLGKKVNLGVNSNLVTYNMEGLLGNIDPILNVTIEDESTEFNEVESISKTFDEKIAEAFTNINSYNTAITNLKASLKLASDEDKASIQADIDSNISAKEELKDETISYIDEAFSTLEIYIDENENNMSLFEKIKNIYVYAIQYENENQIYNVCNNSEVSGNVNSVYEKSGKVYFGNKVFTRKAVVPESEITGLSKMMTKIPDEKLAKVNAKIDTMTETIASSNSKSSEKNVNLLLDVKELLKNEMLYGE